MRNLIVFSLFWASIGIHLQSTALAQVILHVGEGRDCPSFTKPTSDGYCKAVVKNKFTGAYLNGGCPPGSGPVGQGYCMYDY